MKINKEIIPFGSKIDRLRFFLKEGHILPHLIDRFKWHVYPRLHYVGSFPTHVDIKICNKCNLACPMCFREETKFGEGLMDFDLYKRIVDQCAENGVYSIKLSWRGEASLHPRLAEMVAYAKNQGIREVALLTNGTLLNKEKATALTEAGLDWVTISFDGLGETYEKIRYPAKYEEGVERIRQLREIRNKLGKKKPLIKVQTIQSAIKDDPGAYHNVFAPIADKVLYIPDRHEFAEVDHDPNFVCPFSWERLTVTWSGKVAQCITDVNELGVLGDVHHTSLKGIWHGEKLQHVRELQVNHRRLELAACQLCRRFINLYAKPYGYSLEKEDQPESLSNGNKDREFECSTLT